MKHLLRAYLKDPVIDGQKRHVEGTAAQIENKHVLLPVLLVQTVSDGGGRRFVDDPHDVEPGDHAGILGRLTLRVVKVRGHRDDGVRDLLAEVRLGRLLHLPEHHRGDLLGGEHLVALARRDANVRLRVLLEHLEREELDVVLYGRVGPLAAYQPLRVEHRVLGVRRQLVLGGVADQPLALRRECHVRRSYAVALIVGDDLNPSVLIHADAEKKSKPFIKYQLQLQGPIAQTSIKINRRVAIAIGTNCVAMALGVGEIVISISIIDSGKISIFSIFRLSKYQYY